MNKILLVFILLYNALVYADNRHPLIITDVQSKAKFNDYWKVPRARGEHMQLVFMSLSAATNPSQELVQVAQDFDQIMYVVEGKAELDLSGEISQVKGGDMIIIPAGVVYHLKNLNPNYQCLI
jgi:mannose-6-phosphate isomerase-like protein (cupin superfamily)